MSRVRFSWSPPGKKVKMDPKSNEAKSKDKNDITDEDNNLTETSSTAAQNGSCDSSLANFEFSPTNSTLENDNSVTDLSCNNSNDSNDPMDLAVKSKYTKGENKGLTPVKAPFAGLVNYGNTCYLNTLLQGLFMTPEFRDFVWSWNSDNFKPGTFPFELQKIFAEMNASKKLVVGTRDLIKTLDFFAQFQNDQQDVVELWHLLLNKFEQQFEKSDEWNKIKDLYEGVCVDYVRCLECNYYSPKLDSIRDIALSIKSFNKTYESIEESLNAYIEPELLVGPNQYACTKCMKNCDAHKGLAILKLPYILFFHLKRFDMQNTKLNDRVTYPEYLELDDFMNKNQEITKEYSTDTEKATDKTQDDGVEVKNNTYELYFIAVHAGVARTGHFNCYIKSFETKMWYLFDDNGVYAMPQDIWKSAFGDSLEETIKRRRNAYFLGYRKVCSRNVMCVETASVPEALQSKLETYKEDLGQLGGSPKSQSRISSTSTMSDKKINVYFLPENDMPMPIFGVVRFYCSGTTTLAEAKSIAIDKFSFSIPPLHNLCRLVTFNDEFRVVEHSFTTEDISIGYIENSTFLLELRDEDEEFKIIDNTYVMFKAYKLDVMTEKITFEIIVKLPRVTTVSEMIDIVAKQIMMDPLMTCFVIDSKENGPMLLSRVLVPVSLYVEPGVRFYIIEHENIANDENAFFASDLDKLVRKFRRCIHVTMRYPSKCNIIRTDLSKPDPYHLSMLHDEGIFHTWASATQANEDELVVGVTVPLSGTMPWLYLMLGRMFGVYDQLIDIYKIDCGDITGKGQILKCYPVTVKSCMCLSYCIFNLPFELRVDIRELEPISVTLLDLADKENSLKIKVDIAVPLPYTIGLCKKKAIAAIAEKFNLNLRYDKCRLRKFVQNVTTVYCDYETLEKCMISSLEFGYKFCIQNVADGKKLYSSNPEAVFIFVIQQHLKTNTLGLVKEIFLEVNDSDTFVKKLSIETGIPLECLMIWVTHLGYPFDIDAILATPSDRKIKWEPATTKLTNWSKHIDRDGRVIFYGDFRDLEYDIVQPMKQVKLNFKTENGTEEKLTDTVITGLKDSVSTHVNVDKNCDQKVPISTQTDINNDANELNGVDISKKLNSNEIQEFQGNENFASAKIDQRSHSTEKHNTVCMK